MSWTRIKPDGKGGFNVFENWTMGDDFMDAIWGTLVKIPVIILMFLFAPAILLLIAPLNYDDEKQNKELAIGTLICSGLFFIDFCFGGIFWTYFMGNGFEDAMFFFARLHILFLVWGIWFFFIVTEKLRVQYLVFYGGFFLVAYFGWDVLEGIANFLIAETPMGIFEDIYLEEVAERTLD